MPFNEFVRGVFQRRVIFKRQCSKRFLTGVSDGSQKGQGAILFVFKKQEHFLRLEHHTYTRLLHYIAHTLITSVHGPCLHQGAIGAQRANCFNIRVGRSDRRTKK